MSNRLCLSKGKLCCGLPVSKKFCLLVFSFFALIIFSSPVFGQTKTVSGVVKNDQGEPLASVTVSVKGSASGVSSDAQGKFSLQVPDGNTILVFSAVGYGIKEVNVAGQTTLDVQLDTRATEMSDVVVVANGTQRKATLSGAVADLKGSELLKSPAINLSNSLAGRIAGLTVVGQGGEPGNDFSTILVRGVNTYKNGTPLFVVDGIPLQGSDKLQRIDPSVVESITVLKDASAAIYGSQGANGVILITTKRGKAGKISVSATFNQGFSQPTKLPNLLNSYEIGVLQNEALDADPTIPTPSWHTDRYSVYELAAYLRNDDPWHYANTDWMGETLKNWARQNYANVSFSGGSEKLRGSLSISYRYQDGFYDNGSGKYKQFDLRGNMDFNPSRYVLFSVDLNSRVDDANFPIQDAGRIFHQTVGAPASRRAY